MSGSWGGRGFRKTIGGMESIECDISWQLAEPVSQVECCTKPLSASCEALLNSELKEAVVN
eukprot:5734123-Amphidinium_carterae.1